MSLKDLLREWQNSDSKFKRAIHVATKSVWRTWQFATIPELRWQRITGWMHPNEQYQRSTYTAPNRYPDLFDACRQHLDPISAPTILSFGCSTGDELLSLAECIPRATIIGVDINPWCLQQARRKCKGDRFDFCLRTESNFEQIRDCDAIFCLAVFQRTENRNLPGITESTGIRFEQFEREIEVLDSKLKPGGLLVIDQSDFSFTDTTCSGRYDALNVDGNRATRGRPLFDRNNRKISDEQCLHRIFVKRAD